MLLRSLFSLMILFSSALTQEDKIPTHSLIEIMRQQRDSEMLAGRELPDEDKKNFKGLNYFPIDLKYRFILPIHKYAKADNFDIIASDGRRRRAKRYGYFDFTIDGDNCRLQVYRLADVAKKYPNLLFIPFTDATSNRESYGGGRYLDLTEHAKDEYVIDFNLAYNPSCAYGKSIFSCPIPPAENHLKVRIEAGEKKWKH